MYCWSIYQLLVDFLCQKGLILISNIMLGHFVDQVVNQLTKLYTIVLKPEKSLIYMQTKSNSHFLTEHWGCGRALLQFDFTYRAHFTIFRFLFNISVSIRGKNTKFYFKNLHMFRQLHAKFWVNWFIITDITDQYIK